MSIHGSYYAKTTKTGHRSGTIDTEVEIYFGIRPLPYTSSAKLGIQKYVVAAERTEWGVIVTVSCDGLKETWNLYQAARDIYNVKYKNYYWKYLPESTVIKLINGRYAKPVNSAGLLNGLKTGTVEKIIPVTAPTGYRIKNESARPIYLHDTVSRIEKVKGRPVLYLSKTDIRGASTRTDGTFLFCWAETGETYALADVDVTVTPSEYVIRFKPDSDQIIAHKLRFAKKFLTRYPDISQIRIGKEIRFELRGESRYTKEPLNDRDLTERVQRDGILTKYMDAVTRDSLMFPGALDFYGVVRKAPVLSIEDVDFADTDAFAHLHGNSGKCLGYAPVSPRLYEILERTGMEDIDMLLLPDCKEYRGVLPVWF